MKDSFCTYILIIADNSIEKLDKTIDSILKQTIERELLRVLIIDNASQDGTYNKLVEYEIKYPELISVIREKQPTTRGRMLKSLIRHLRYTQVGSSLLLNPGDIIYPDFIQEARTLLKLKKDIKCLVYEVDLFEGDRVVKQNPIFTENCILTHTCKDIFYKYGIGHKVQVFYRRRPIDLSAKLPYYEVREKHHDWLALSFYWLPFSLHYSEYDNVYLKKTVGCVCKETNDFKQELMEWAFFIKRTLYPVETQVVSTKDAADINKEEIAAAYNCLAVMALQYALRVLKKGLFEDAEDALIFAEMMKADIVEDHSFKKLQEAVFLRKYEESLDTLLIEESIKPPRICEQF